MGKVCSSTPPNQTKSVLWEWEPPVKWGLGGVTVLSGRGSPVRPCLGTGINSAVCNWGGGRVMVYGGVRGSMFMVCLSGWGETMSNLSALVPSSVIHPDPRLSTKTKPPPIDCWEGRGWGIWEVWGKWGWGQAGKGAGEGCLAVPGCKIPAVGAGGAQLGSMPGWGGGRCPSSPSQYGGVCE